MNKAIRIFKWSFIFCSAASLIWFISLNVYNNSTDKQEIASLESQRASIFQQIHELQVKNVSLLSEKSKLHSEEEELKWIFNKYYPDTKSWSRDYLWRYIENAYSDKTLRIKLMKNPSFFSTTKMRSTNEVIKLVRQVRKLEEHAVLDSKITTLSREINTLQAQVPTIEYSKLDKEEYRLFLTTGLLVINSILALATLYLIIRIYSQLALNTFNPKTKRIIIVAFFGFLLLVLILYGTGPNDTLWHHLSESLFNSLNYHLIVATSTLTLYWLAVAGINWIRKAES